MLGLAIGGALGIAGQVLGGISGSKAAREERRALRAQQQKNQNWYDRRYNEDATQRADAQRLLNRVEESVKRRNKAAAGTAAVMGGSPEAAAAARAQNNEAISDAVSQISANAEARKDTIEQQYLERDAQLEQQLIGAKANQRAQVGTAVAQGLGTLGGVVSGMLDVKDNKE